MKKYESFYKLLRETDAKEVVEAINRMYYADKEEIFPYAYKGAYDQLMHMPKEVIINNDGYAVHVYNYHNTEKPFALTNCEGMAWKMALALPVIVEDSIELTPTETVAAVIWALTFYGFSEREAKEFFEGMDREMEEGETTSVDEFWEDDNEEDDEEEEEHVPLSPEDEERKRKEERAEKVEHAMMELLAQSEGLEVKDLIYLFDTSLICEIWPHTYAYDTDKRMGYLLELITNYCNVKPGFNRIALCVTSSPDYPLTDEEEKMLVEKLKNMINGGQVLVAKRYHKDIEKELQATILFSKD